MPTGDAPDDWTAEAAGLPVAFAQVREDARLDRELVRRRAAERSAPGRSSLPDSGGLRVLMIASGGCTAAVLACEPAVARIDLVDAGMAQLALTRLKLALLGSHSPSARRAVLGHAPMDPTARGRELDAVLAPAGFPADALGPAEFVARVGPDFAGRYERCFVALREELRQAGALPAVEGLLALRDPAEQSVRLAPSAPLGRAVDAAMDRVLSLANLVRLFGGEATRNPVQPFSRHFAGRLRAELALRPAADNPFVHQMLLARYPQFPAGGSMPGADWLDLPSPGRMPEVAWHQSMMADALGRTEAGTCDIVHLSNILDWLAPAAATEVLALTARALRPGGWTIVRRLNSTLDIPALGTELVWDESLGAALHAADRSFFYRSLHVGRRP